jgi:hypothetical protein
MDDLDDILKQYGNNASTSSSSSSSSSSASLDPKPEASTRTFHFS